VKTLVIPYLSRPKPWSTNADRNKGKRENRVAPWRDGAYYAARQYRLRRRLTIPLDRSNVTMVIPFDLNKKERDPHNYCGTVVKAAIDGLVLAGFWPSDTVGFVTHTEPLLVIDREGDMMPEVHITIGAPDPWADYELPEGVFKQGQGE